MSRRYGAPRGKADCVAHFEQYLKTGKLKAEPPVTISRLRGTEEYPTLDVTDDRVRMILDQIIFNDWRTAYAYASQLRDLATKEIQGKEIDNTTSFESNLIVANTIIQLLGAQLYVSDPGGYSADHGGHWMNKHVLSSTVELVERFGVPHGE